MAVLDKMLAVAVAGAAGDACGVLTCGDRARERGFPRPIAAALNLVATCHVCVRTAVLTQMPERCPASSRLTAWWLHRSSPVRLNASAHRGCRHPGAGRSS